MPGSAQEIRYINRDENTDLWLFRNMILQLRGRTGAFYERKYTALKKMLMEGVEQEIAWGHYVLGDDIPADFKRNDYRIYKIYWEIYALQAWALT